MTLDFLYFSGLSCLREKSGNRSCWTYYNTTWEFFQNILLMSIDLLGDFILDVSFSLWVRSLLILIATARWLSCSFWYRSLLENEIFNIHILLPSKKLFWLESIEVSCQKTFTLKNVCYLKNVMDLNERNQKLKCVSV